MADPAFALGTFSAPGAAPFAGVVADGARVLDLAASGWATTRAALEEWAVALPVLEGLADDDGQAWQDLAGLDVHAPVVPTQVLQSGANYRRHVIDLIAAEERAKGELSEEEARAKGARIMDARAASGEPYIFLGTPTSMCGPYDDVQLPAEGEQHDWELELAAVIGAGGHNIPLAQAMDHVAGYTIVNDLTTRDRVYRPDIKAIGTDWLRGKSAPTFLPTGPWIVPSGLVGDPGDLTITLRLNGDVMQNESTADMIFDTARLVAYASERVRLVPGDLLLTGSPAGNGQHYGRFLAPGDVMEGEITGLGRQRNRCIAAPS